jgi:hypothetical protein
VITTRSVIPFELMNVESWPARQPAAAAVPHVLVEVAVDDDELGLVHQALAYCVDEWLGPVVDVGVGLRAGAVDERDAGAGCGRDGGGRRRAERECEQEVTHGMSPS